MLFKNALIALITTAVNLVEKMLSLLEIWVKFTDSTCVGNETFLELSRFMVRDFPFPFDRHLRLTFYSG